MACAPHVLAGVRGAGDVGAYIEFLKRGEMSVWGGDVDDACDSRRGESDAGGDGTAHALHDAAVTSEVIDAAAHLVEACSQEATSASPLHSMCVLSHWPHAPPHLLCNCTSSEQLPRSSSPSAPSFPCYWLSLVSSVRLTEAEQSRCIDTTHISQAINRWSLQQASPLASSMPSSLNSILHRVALEIHSNVSSKSLLKVFSSPLSFPPNLNQLFSFFSTALPAPSPRPPLSSRLQFKGVLWDMCKCACLALFAFRTCLIYSLPNYFLTNPTADAGATLVSL